MPSIALTVHGSQFRGVKPSLAERAALAERHGYECVDFTLADAATLGDPGAVAELFARHHVAPGAAGGVLSADLYADEAAFTTALDRVPDRARLAAACGSDRTG